MELAVDGYELAVMVGRSPLSRLKYLRICWTDCPKIWQRDLLSQADEFQDLGDRLTLPVAPPSGKTFTRYNTLVYD